MSDGVDPSTYRDQYAPRAQPVVIAPQHDWSPGDQVQVIATLQSDTRFAGRVGIVLGHTIDPYWVAKQQIVVVEFNYGPEPPDWKQRKHLFSKWLQFATYFFAADELEPAKYDRIMLSVHVLAPDTDDQSDEIARHTSQIDMVKLRAALDSVVKSVDPGLETWVE